MYEDAQQADLLRQQIAATAKRIGAQNAVAKQAEAEMQVDRQALATLNKKWNAIRADKDRTVCRLDAGILGVLRAVGSGHAPAR